MSEEIARQLANAGNVYLIAPAGYGKTEVIAKAVTFQEKGKVLLLTHTHAGVRSLKERLHRLGASPKQYRVETIASWGLHLAKSYPKLSGITVDQPIGDEWQEVYKFAQNALQCTNIKYVIEKSYRGIFVDEYQDCTKSQHTLIMSLAGILPVRILGDPLQGIFGFDEDPLIDWDIDIYPFFEDFGQLEEPWRWKETNPELGNWLNSVRNPLIAGEEFDIRNAPTGWVNWIPTSQSAGRTACFNASRLAGSVVAIQKWPNQAHSLARQLRGVYTSMEEIECKDLITWARNLDQSNSLGRCQLIIDGAGKCWTGLKGNLRNIRNGFSAGRTPRSKNYSSVVEKLGLILTAPDDSQILLSALRACSSAGDILFRRELWREMQRVLEVFQGGEFESLEDAAWHIRNQTRRQGRYTEHRVVSRTLLIKGLEFDHVVIVNADDLDDPRNLYVALTRCKHSLTVISSSPIIRRPPL